MIQQCYTIRVSYNTRPGPIEPPKPTPTPYYVDNHQTAAVVQHIPAPVFEITENDLPNPLEYYPYLPYQYRKKVRASFEKAPVSIYYGSEYDQKYGLQLPYATLRKIAQYNALAQQKNATSSQPKTSIISQRSLNRDEGQPLGSTAALPNPTVPVQTTTTLANNAGLNYRGPQTFGPEHFAPTQPRFNTVQYFGRPRQADFNRRTVPQFGVLYSAGVRYYVPRLDDYDSENSVYERHDVKKY